MHFLEILDEADFVIVGTREKSSCRAPLTGISWFRLFGLLSPGSESTNFRIPVPAITLPRSSVWGSGLLA